MSSQRGFVHAPIPLADVYAKSTLSLPLKKRLIRTSLALAERPNEGFPSALGAAQYTGMQRMLHHDDFFPAAQYEPIARHLLAECQALPTVLAVYDTTQFAFSGQRRRLGLGNLRYPHDQGFFFHACLLVDPQAHPTPLGVLDAIEWTRDWQRTHSHDAQRESERWSALAHRVSRVLRQQSTAVVHVCDREADDFAFFAKIQAWNDTFVIRLAHDRILETHRSKDAARKHISRKVSSLLQTPSPYEQTRTVTLSTRSTVAARQSGHHPRVMRSANLVIRAYSTTIRRPDHQATTLPSELPVQVVFVDEESVPEGQEAVQWRLVSNRSITRPEEILEIVDIYRARWLIEEYFKALKSGCGYEQRQAESYEILRKVLWMLLPIAANMLRLRHVQQARPSEVATCQNTGLPAEAIELLQHQTSARSPLTTTEVLQATARLGGWLNPKRPIGWQLLYRGYQRLITLAHGWNIAKNALANHSAKTDQS